MCEQIKLKLIVQNVGARLRQMTGHCMFRPKKIGKGFRMEAIHGSDGGEMGGQN